MNTHLSTFANGLLFFFGHESSYRDDHGEELTDCLSVDQPFIFVFMVSLRDSIANKLNSGASHNHRQRPLLTESSAFNLTKQQIHTLFAFLVSYYVHGFHASMALKEKWDGMLMKIV